MKFEYASNGGIGRYVCLDRLFRIGTRSAELDDLIDENIIVTNDLIFAELISFLKLKHLH